MGMVTRTKSFESLSAPNLHPEISAAYDGTNHIHELYETQINTLMNCLPSQIKCYLACD